MKITTKTEALIDLFIDHRHVRLTETGIKRITRHLMMLEIEEKEIPNIILNHFEFGDWALPIIMEEVTRFNKKEQ